MFTLFAAMQFEAAQKWFDHLSTNELLTLTGLVVIAVALGLREAKEHRIARDFGQK